MPAAYCYTEDDLETESTHTAEHELEWAWSDGTATYTAVLRLEEGDTGPHDIEGPCIATYTKTGKHGSISSHYTPLDY